MTIQRLLTNNMYIYIYIYIYIYVFIYYYIIIIIIIIIIVIIIVIIEHLSDMGSSIGRTDTKLHAILHL